MAMLNVVSANDVTQLLYTNGMYNYNDKTRIVRDVMAVVEQVRSLVPKASQFVHNDGRIAVLLHLEGTTPIFYKGAQYNIPVTLWIVEDYPNVAPFCFVTPTRDMRIKQNHKHVGPQGRVFLPYLQQWTAQRSTLGELVTIMSSIFSQDPPVYRHVESVQPQPVFNPYATPNNSPPQQPSPAELLRQEEESRRKKEDSAKRQAIAEVTLNLQTKMRALHQRMTRDVDELLELQQKLQEGKGVLDEHMIQSERHYAELNNQMEAINKRRANLKRFLANNSNHAQQVDIEETVRPKDSRSKQLLDLLAEDHAIDDTLECFDRALADDRMNLTDFLKQTRKLARRQFEVRALSHKVFEAQLSEHRGPPLSHP